jgi:hypothetical protein
MNKLLIVSIFLAMIICLSNCQESTSTITTPSFNPDDCDKPVNSTCQECLGSKKCFFCNEDDTCRTYKISGIFPAGCKASQSRWFTCYLDFQALLIGVSVTGGIIVLIILGCLCYCCNKTCKAMSDRRYTFK